jgi:hypothetical protein
VGGLFVYSTLQALGVVPDGTRSERVGPYEIAYATYDAFGHRGTQRTLYYRGAGGRHLVARSISGFRLNPNDPAVLLFEHCPSIDAVDCGIHLYDGRREESWKVSDEQLLGQSATQVEWSRDNRFALLAAAYSLYVIDVRTPNSRDLSATLGLREGRRSLRLGEWSPDGQRIAALAAQFVDPAPPFVTLAEDLVVIDLATASVSYVATAQPTGWRGLRYEWMSSALGYVLAVPAEPPGFGRSVYQKGPADIPLGVLPQ